MILLVFHMETKVVCVCVLVGVVIFMEMQVLVGLSWCVLVYLFVYVHVCPSSFDRASRLGNLVLEAPGLGMTIVIKKFKRND